MKQINFVLKKMGLVCAREKTVRMLDKEMSVYDAIWSRYLQPIFYIDADMMTDMFAMSFDKDNPYTRSLTEHIEKPDTEYESSALCRFYEIFQPSSVDDVFLSGNGITTDKSDGLFSYQLPWDIVPKTNNGHKMNYSGPMDIKRGKAEYERLIDVYDSIKKQGYMIRKSENLFNSNNIQGYFLKNNDEYSFIVLHGKHRAASLIALGEKKIPVTFDLGYQRVIDRAAVEDWPLVKKGQMSKEKALMIFDAFFNRIGE